MCLAASRSSLGLEVEDVACAVLDFASGTLAEVAVDNVAGAFTRGFELVARRQWPRGAGATAPSSSRAGTASARSPVRSVDGMYERLVDDFLDAVAKRRNPRTSGEEGLAVLRTVEAAKDAARRGAGVEPSSYCSEAPPVGIPTHGFGPTSR